MNNERQLDRVLEGAFCPEAAVLGQFLDESLSADLQERVAGHVLRCCACQDVVAWTREAAAQPLSQRKSKTATGRRRRIRPAAKQGLPSWVPGVAAAAGLLLVAFVALKASDTQPSGQLGQATPSASPTPSKIQPQPSPSRATPRPTTAPSLRPSLPSPTPQASVRPTPAASPGATPSPSATPAPSVSPTPSPSATPGDTRVEPVAPPRGVWVAALEPGVTWRKPGGKRTPLGSGAELPAAATIHAQQAAAIQVGSQRVELGARAVLGLARAGVRHLEGEALISGQGTIDCGQVQIQGAPGDEVFVERYRGALLLVVVAGAPRGPQGALAPGQAFRIAGGALEPAPRVADLKRRAAKFSGSRAGQAALNVPGGLAIRAAFDVARGRLRVKEVAKRAQALRVVEACWAAAPRLAAGSLVELEAAHAELEALAPAALVAERAGPDYALAAVARARRTKTIETARPRLTALATALRADPANLASPDGLLALRAIERLTKSRDADFWRRAGERVAAASPSGPNAALVRALVGGPKAARAELAALDLALAADPLTAPVTPALLWGAAQRLILANAWTPERARRLRGHLEVHLGQAIGPELGYLAARHATRVLGGKIRAESENRRRALPIEGGYRVTFVFSSPRKPRTVHLCGSWDDWKEDTTPMTRRRDGSFEVTIELAPGRHEYKLRLDGGRLWEIDADNALETADTRGGKNSVILLPTR